MPPVRKSKIGVTGASEDGLAISVGVQIQGVAKTTDEFKRVRREINGRLRDTMERVGTQYALPAARIAFPSRTFGSTLYVKRDRAGVFIGSRARGPLNRAVGWLDFGGKRPNDRAARKGPYTLVRTMDTLRPKIDDEILQGLLAEFNRAFEVS